MTNAILKDGWIYAADSANDSIAREGGADLVGGTKYEIYGMAVRYTETSFDFAISTNLPDSGVINYEGERVYPGDVFLNFGNQSSFDAANGSPGMYALHFADSNEAGVGPTGVYSNVTAASVALRNGLDLDGGIADYNAYVSRNGGTPSLGTLTADSPYFNQTDPGSVPNVISSGTLVSAGINSLAQLPDFQFPGMTGLGSNTLGGSVDRSALQGGPVTIHFAPECDNDVTAIEINPGIDIIKKTRGVDAKTPEEAVILFPEELFDWTFEVTNTGNVTFLEQDIQVTDTTLGIPLDEEYIEFKGDGDNLLSPGETWIYSLGGIARDLSNPGSFNPILTVIDQVLVDFETDALGNPLAAGTIIDDEYSAFGLTVSQQIYSEGQPQFGAMIFDTENPTVNDEDLRSDILGNVLIISEDGDSSNPNDSVYGGIIRFDFDYLVNNLQVGLFDVDSQYNDEAVITGYRRLDNGSYQAIESMKVEGGPGEGYIPEVDLLTDANGFDRIDVSFKGSFAITDLEFDRVAPVYGNTAVVTINNLPGITDTDSSHYYNGFVPPKPSINLEKKTNGFDADTPKEAVSLMPGELFTWTFEVTNTGNVPFAGDDVEVVDKTLGTQISKIDSKGDGDGTLSPGETWIYSFKGIAKDLSKPDVFKFPLASVQEFVIDFETDALGNPLAAGTIIDDEYSALGVMVSQQIYSQGQPQFGAMIFDTDNPTESDEDLRSDILGNVLIISEDGDSSNPNDSVYGGIIRFDFDYLVNNLQVGLFDVDSQYDDEAVITGYRRLDDGSYQAIESLRVEGGPGEGYIPDVDLLTDVNGFDRIDVSFKGSFAITNLEFDRLSPVFANTAQVTIKGRDLVSDIDTSYYQNWSAYSSPLVQPDILSGPVI